ncbi:MAG: GC-type dockerin domain-anchored protein [Phycisphaerales bacterium]
MKMHAAGSGVLALLLVAGSALAIDVTRPGDAIIPSSNNSPGAEGVTNAIDNTAATKYLNFDVVNTGFTVTPSGTGTVRYVTCITANDAPERDPTTYTLEGSNDGFTFDLISSGALTPSINRYSIFSSNAIPNASVYAMYRVIFPTVRGAANSMQIAEVQLATAVDITSPDDTVSITLPPGGTTAPGEGVASLFDNRLNTKLDVQNATGGPTIVDVTPLVGPTVITGFSFFSANDDVAFPGRTPQNVTIMGSNDGVVYDPLFSTGLTQAGADFEDQEYEFANATAYARYRIVFDIPYFSTDMQVGEFQLYGFAPNQAPPINDECANASVITAGSVSGTTNLASGADISSCGGGDSSDVWYSYTAPASGLVALSTCESSLNTTVSVFASCGGAQIACDDNGCGLQSYVLFNANINETYLIRVAAVGETGNFRLSLTENAVEHTNQTLDLNWNFNGMTHAGEEGQPDAPNGYRSISDRGLRIDANQGDSIAAGTIRSDTGLVYEVVGEANTLDIVHLGDRNTVDNFNHVFDDVVDGDEVGVQPDWLPNSDQTGPQTTDVTGANIVLGADTKLGVLYQISNGGGFMILTLGFADGAMVQLGLDGPDWFFDQVPGAPANGVESQAQLGVFAGTQNVDLADAGASLNVVEAVVSTASLSLGGFGDFTGRQLTSITFSDRSNTIAGYAIIAASVLDNAGAPPCPGDFNGDGFVNSQDFFDFLVAFFSLAPSADFNNDGSINSQDFFDFLVAFFAGC